MKTVKRIFKHFFRHHETKQLHFALDVPVVDKQFLINHFKDATRQGAAQSTTKWYLNNLQCNLLKTALTWSMIKVENEHVIDEQLCLELCRIVGRARNLLDSCFQVQRENPPKFITSTHTCEAFGPLILLLVRSIILIQAKSHHWSEDAFEKRVQEEYEINWEPKLIKVAHVDQMRWLEESKELSQVQSQSTDNVPVHVRQRMLSSGHVVKRLGAPSEDFSILYFNKDDIEFSLQSRVGSGAFGNVYKVKWLGEWCAYKEFDGAENASFEREVAVLSTLHHPHIVHFIGCLIEQDRCALLMELLDCDLKHFLKLKEMAKLDVVVALDMMLQVAQGMRYLHDKGIVHRDLKAANILVNCLGGRKHAIIGGYVLKVTDFGLAKTKFKSMETLRTHNVGTFQWTAPELFKTVSDEGVINVEPTKYVFPKKADVYSFGILCSEILTSGKVPFSESHEQRKILKEEILKGRRPILPDTCPQFLASFIESCWHESPERRPEFDHVCTSLERFKVRALTAISHSSSSQERRNAQSPSPANAPVPLIEFETRPENFKLIRFTMYELKYATHNFCESCRIGQGDFGTVYRGQLRDGTTVAVKRPERDKFHLYARNEFYAELNMQSQAEHLNVVRLIGYSVRKSELMLVTEYVSNGDLRRHLHDVPIIYRDVKSSNILLTGSFRAKLADFGLSRAGPLGDVQTHVSTIVKGTSGYLDPEYFSTGQLNVKSDVYSFGILLLELLTGRRPIELKGPSDEYLTVRWAYKLYLEGKLNQIIDPNLKIEAIMLTAMKSLFELAFSCCASTKVDRPKSSEASEILWKTRKLYDDQLHAAETSNS